MSLLFPQALAALLEKSGESQREFSLAVKFKQPSLAHILRGRRKVPLRQVEKWADHFRLRGERRDRFIMLAHLDHSVSLIRAFVVQEHPELVNEFK